MLKHSKKEKTVKEGKKSISDKISSSDKISIDDDGKTKIDDRTTAMDANTFFLIFNKAGTTTPVKIPTINEY